MTEVLQVVTRAPDVYRQAQGDDSGKGAPRNWHAICVENSAGDTGATRADRPRRLMRACLLLPGVRAGIGARWPQGCHAPYFLDAQVCGDSEGCRTGDAGRSAGVRRPRDEPRLAKPNGFTQAGDAKRADRGIPAARKAEWIAAPAPPPRSRRCAQATCCTPDRRQPGRRPT